MPNHIKNILELKGEQSEIDKVFDYIKGEKEDQFIDFEKIATPPNYIYMGATNRIINDIFDTGEKQSIFNRKSDTWSTWCVRYWGTKWNAYEIEKEGNTLIFETAWNGVPRLILLLGNKFKKVDFFYKYADEDWGRNLGYLNITDDGSLFMRNIEYKEIDSGTKEAFEFASEVRGATSDYGKYTWDEENKKIEYIDVEDLESD